MADMKKTQQSSFDRYRRRAVLWLGAAILTGLALFALSRLVEPPPAPEPPQAIEPVPTGQRAVSLYFASADGSALAAEGREINDCIAEQDCMVDALRELIKGPQGELFAVLPATTQIRGVAVDQALASVDFSRDLVASHPGGTQSELLTVYAVVNTLAVNFPHIRQVRFLVDGQVAETLKGHVDLRQPLGPDYSLVQEGEAPVGNLKELPPRREE